MRYPFWNQWVFLFLTYGPYGGHCSDASQSGEIFFGMWLCAPRLGSIAGYPDNISDVQKKGNITWFEDLLCIRTGGIYTSDAGHASCLAWPGTLWPEGSSGLSWFPHWFRHQTGQGRVWIPRWVESTQKSRRHEKKWDAQNEEKTKFPTIYIYSIVWVFSFFVCCFVFSQLKQEWHEAV